MATYNWSPFYAITAYLGLGLALVILLLLARRFASSPSARSWRLLLLRALVLSILVFLLTNPLRVAETQLPPQVPEMVYLIDCSRSMALDGPTSRLSQVKRILKQADRLSTADPPPRVSYYRFGRHVRVSPSVAQLCAEDDVTRLLEALRQLPSRFGRQRPDGVTVFSDGRTTEIGDFAEIATVYRRLGVPIHVLPVGDPKVIGDVAIEQLVVPRDISPGTRVPVRVGVRSRGYSGHRAEIRIGSAANASRKPLATLPVTLVDGSQTHELIIEPDTAGGKLVVEVPVLRGEAIEENNQVPFQIASRDKKVRVIYMEGGSRSDADYLRDALAEDPNVECLVMSADNPFSRQPRLYRYIDRRRGYPATRKELFGYDVVICSDIYRGAFTEEQLRWTVELVAERGGGFAMVGGNASFGSGDWDKTVWETLIPFAMSGASRGPLGTGYLFGSKYNFRVKVPAAAESHPIWRIVEDPVENRQVLDRMPQFYGTNLIERLKSAAFLLGHSDRSLVDAGHMPIFACQTFGKGRTFAMTTDTTPAWGREFQRHWGEGDNRYFRKFCGNLVHWLAESSGDINQRLRAETDKVIYCPGQPIEVTVQAWDEKLKPTDRYRLVTYLRPEGDTRDATETSLPETIQEVTLSPKGNEPIYHGELTAPSTQSVAASSAELLSPLRVLALDVVAYDRDTIVARTTVDVQILDDPVEFHNPQPDAARLEDLASAAGGKVLHTAEDLARPLQRESHAPGEVAIHQTPIWDHPALWCLLLVLLAMEWTLRRLRGLA